MVSKGMLGLGIKIYPTTETLLDWLYGVLSTTHLCERVLVHMRTVTLKKLKSVSQWECDFPKPSPKK